MFFYIYSHKIFFWLFLLVFGLQIIFWLKTERIRHNYDIVPPAPSKQFMNGASFGDKEFLFRIMATNLQNFGDDIDLEKSRESLGLGLKILSVIFPRLDLFSQSSWAVYGLGDNSFLQIIFIQSIIYLPLMIFMAFHDFKKKQF